jgi:hypothetical protein
MGFTSSWSDPGGLLNILLIPFALAGAALRQRRLDRILAQYPYSLLCAECGHIERRQFDPDDEDANKI